jgi:hypothetical protein
VRFYLRHIFCCPENLRFSLSGNKKRHIQPERYAKRKSEIFKDNAAIHGGIKQHIDNFIKNSIITNVKILSWNIERPKINKKLDKNLFPDSTGKCNTAIFCKNLRWGSVS